MGLLFGKIVAWVLETLMLNKLKSWFVTKLQSYSLSKIMDWFKSLFNKNQ